MTWSTNLFGNIFFVSFYNFRVIDKYIIISKSGNDGFIYDDFIDLIILSWIKREISNLSNININSICFERTLPPQISFKYFYVKLKQDFVSSSWIFCYLPFHVRHSFLFLTIIPEFFFRCKVSLYPNHAYGLQHLVLVKPS